jgi:predicted Zn-dependent peptidase
MNKIKAITKKGDSFFDIKYILFYNIFVLFFNRGIKMKEVDYLDQVKDPFSGFVALESDGIPVYHLYCPDSICHRVAIILLCGSNDEPVRGSGVAHFLEHIIARQCYDKTDNLSELFLEIGASTTFRSTYYEVTGHRDRLEEGYAEIVRAISSPDYSLMEAERSIILSEAFPSGYEALREKKIRHERSFGIGYADIIGDYSQILSVNQEMIHDFHRKMYTLGNIVIISLGGIVDEELVGICNKHPFHLSWADTVQKISNIPDLKKDCGINGLIYCPDNKMSVIDLFFMIPTVNQCLVIISWRMMKSILYERLREEEGLIYGVDGGWIDYGGFYEVNFLIKGIHHYQLNRVIALVKECLMEVRSRQDILEKVKKEQLRRYLYNDISDNAIFSSAIRKVVDRGYVEEDKERLKRELSVSMEELVGFMEMFSLENMFMNLYTDKEETIDISVLP